MIPEAVLCLPNLEMLRISENQITVLDYSLTRLPKLAVLDVSHNNLSILPESIGKLQRLRQLLLSSNTIRDLGEGITQLKHLQDLALDGNEIENLPEGFGKLESLKILALHDNMLNALSDDFASLTSLEKLDLSGNYFTEQPTQLSKMYKLKDFILGQQNPAVNDQDAKESSEELVVEEARRREELLHEQGEIHQAMVEILERCYVYQQEYFKLLSDPQHSHLFSSDLIHTELDTMQGKLLSVQVKLRKLKFDDESLVVTLNTYQMQLGEVEKFLRKCLTRMELRPRAALLVKFVCCLLEIKIMVGAIVRLERAKA